MIRHVFALVWSRKRNHVLLVVELLVTFLILFALVGFSLNLRRLYGKPLGFNVADTWSISLIRSGALSDADSEVFRQVLAVTRQMEEVRTSGFMYNLPFDIGSSAMNITVGDMQQEEVNVSFVSTGIPQAIGLKLLEGRWFGPEDEAQDAAAEVVAPVVVNKAFSDAAGGNLIGKLIPTGPGQRQRIVGVFEEFRQHGQFSAAVPVMLQRVRPEGTFFEAPRVVLILKPGLPAEFEGQLLATLQRVAPGWDFDVDVWESLQQTHFRLYMIPLMVGSGLVLFLMLMVGSGLLGVLWQNVIRRTPEMGLRRAVGAAASAVRKQVVLEMLAVVAFALVLGLVIVVQFPLGGVIRALDWALFVPSVMLSTMLLLLLCTLFALYPSYQATRQDPVEALRYE